jgi:DNA-binding MarR family transcriptional regulator
METTNLESNLNWLLIRASMVAKQRLIKLSEAFDLTPMQALTICLLEPGDTIPMSTISELLVCDPSNVTGIIERLSNGRFIERRESSSDRRVKTVSLTEEGIVLRKKLIPGISESEATNLAALSREEIRSLKQLLVKTLPVASILKSHKQVSL